MMQPVKVIINCREPSKSLSGDNRTLTVRLACAGSINMSLLVESEANVCSV